MLKSIERLIRPNPIKREATENLKILGLDLPALDLRLKGLSNPQYPEVKEGLLQKIDDPEKRARLSRFIDQRRNHITMVEETGGTRRF